MSRPVPSPTLPSTLLSTLSSTLSIALAWAVVLPGTAGGAAASQDPPPEALVGEIPFHPDTPPSRVMIDLAPEGHRPFVLFLDTGASDSVLTPGMARDLGVSIRRTKSSPYRKGTRLGRDLLFWVDTQTSDTASKTGWEYGLLGARFLDDYVLEIDYPGRVVRFWDPRKYEVPEKVSSAGEVVIPFRRNGNRILAALEVDGVEVMSLLDTGGPAVRIGGDTARKIGIDWSKLPEVEGAAGVMGAVETYTYEAKLVRFGGFEFRDQPIAVSPKGNYNQGADNDSVIGYDVLSRFVMRIDYPNRRIWLREGPVHLKTYYGRSLATGVATVRPAPTAEEVAEQDARRVDEWKRTRASRVYAETSPGRFVVVDGWRLRQGPKDGETWYSHEEMLARREEVERAAAAGE